MKEGEKGEFQSKAEARFTVEAYYKGFRILLTLPYEFDGSGAITGLLDKMLEKGLTPERTIYQAPQLPTPETAGNGNGKEIEAHTCTIHNTEMKRFEKNGQVWYSHKDGDKWCSGKKK